MTSKKINITQYKMQIKGFLNTKTTFQNFIKSTIAFKKRMIYSFSFQKMPK